MQKRFLSLASCALLGLAVSLGVTACDKQGNPKITEAGNTNVTPAKVAKLSKGMNETQVNALFGPPSTTGETKNFGIFSKHTNTWVEGKDSLSVTYKNSEVEEFTSTVGATTSTRTSDSDGGTTTTTSSTNTKSDQ